MFHQYFYDFLLFFKVFDDVSFKSEANRLIIAIKVLYVHAIILNYDYY